MTTRIRSGHKWGAESPLGSSPKKKKKKVANVASGEMRWTGVTPNR